ncbi:MAG: hypothetical protein ABEJ30_05880 [Halorientalis sp.]
MRHATDLLWFVGFMALAALAPVLLVPGLGLETLTNAVHGAAIPVEDVAFVGILAILGAAWVDTSRTHYPRTRSN